MPASALEQIAERNKKRRLYQRTRDPSHLADMKRLSVEIKNKVAQHKNQEYANRLGDISTRDGSIWRLNKHLRRPHEGVNAARDGSIWRLNKHLRRPHEGVNAVQRPDGAYAIQREEVAETMANTFRRYHSGRMAPTRSSGKR
ncbi:hypothetical protein QE152_g37225 [Popillia japonica]|uniref:Uncharacterized protein n=1 Tax=Popillia japonica TaxID=7064 RepID=A0AAW1IAX5_POPJA